MKQITHAVTRDDDTIETLKNLIRTLGSNPDHPELLPTPGRFLNFLADFANPEPFEYSTFDAEKYSEMVIQKNIQFYSLCEHHLLPFFGTATVAYIPDRKLLGLSKLSRLVETKARRLQNQERLTQQIADQLMNVLRPKGVGVVITARHLCMEMRGVRQRQSQTTTSALTGLFREGPTRQEFLQLST